MSIEGHTLFHIKEEAPVRIEDERRTGNAGPPRRRMYE